MTEGLQAFDAPAECHLIAHRTGGRINVNMLGISAVVVAAMARRSVRRQKLSDPVKVCSVKTQEKKKNQAAKSDFSTQ